MISRLTACAVTTAAFAALLSACGGSGGSGSSNPTGQSDTVSVDVSGLSGSLALELTPGDTALTVTADGVTPFGATVSSGASYGVTITTQPAGQYCTLGNSMVTSTAVTVSADVTVSVTCNTSLGGIWKATAASGAQYFEVADEAGEFSVLAANPSVGYGATLTELDSGIASVSNNAVTGTYVGANSTTTGTGTLSGTIVLGSTLDLTTQFAPSGSDTASSQTLDYAYDALYQVPSSLATIANNYIDSTNDVWSITSSGIVTVQGSSTDDCVGNGQVSVIDSRYNVYAITFAYGDCAGSYAYLNGMTFSGIMTLDNELTPAVIVGGASATSGSTGPGEETQYLLPLLLQTD